jgi:predicted RNase H-like HicB family nuclease
MTRSYIGLIRKEADTAYGIDFPDFPGCIGSAETAEACLDDGRAALQAHVQFMLDQGLPLPEPSGLDAVLADPDNHDALAVRVDLPPVKGKAVRLNVTLDAYLLGEVDRAAAAEQMNRSNFLARAARAFLDRDDRRR